MSQRRQIATRADRSAGRHHRTDIVLQHLQQMFSDDYANPAGSLGQYIRSQKKHAANLCFRERIAYAAGMAADQVQLQIGQLISRN